MPDLSTWDWEKLGIVSVLALWVMAFMSGRIYTRSEYQQRIQERDKQTDLATKALDTMQALIGDRR